MATGEVTPHPSNKDLRSCRFQHRAAGVFTNHVVNCVPQIPFSLRRRSCSTYIAEAANEGLGLQFETRRETPVDIKGRRAGRCCSCCFLSRNSEEFASVFRQLSLSLSACIRRCSAVGREGGTSGQRIVRFGTPSWWSRSKKENRRGWL